MDERRLDTAGFMAMGGLNLPKPVTEIPEDRERFDGAEATREEIAAAIEAGKVVKASNYYGIPNVWKESDGLYRGTLLQYRNVTEAPAFDTLDEAVDWFQETARGTDG